MSKAEARGGTFTKYEQDDPGFIQDLRDSKEAVAVAAKWLCNKGYPVVMRPVFERPTASDMREYADEGDLEIIQRIEVKRRQNLEFTSKQDFPYPTVIVDVCHAYDRAHPKPYAYIIFNKSMDRALIIEGRTHGAWAKTRKQDRFKNREREFYECPLELAHIVRLKTN